MTITPEQLKNRKKFLGASDISAILGINPFRTAADVFLEKTCDVLPSADSEAADIGNSFELPMLKWAEKRIGAPLDFDPEPCVASNGIMVSHLDAAVVGADHPVEGKCTAKTEEWGDENTDQIPPMHLIQVHAQMICTETELAYVAAFLAGFRMERRLYRIRVNADLARTIEDEACKWWERHVVAGVMPDSAPSIEVARRIKPKPGLVVPVRPELAKALHDAKEQTKQAAKQEEEIKARLLAELGGADGGDCPGWVVVQKDINVKEYTVAARTDRRLTVKPAK